ncbi:mucin [Rothia aeria]|nr:mucin [Rothia aeria]
MMGLIETFRKNNNEKLKNDQEKEKNDRDHLRQVRAGRRERYTKAVEQLGDEKAPIRMGGVYTLVGLVDEWLEDESIDKYEDRLKEGQVIINNLCAYIRSPFTLASHYDELSNPTPMPEGIYKDKKEKFYADKATLDSETDVRLSIIKEIHDRIQGPDKNTPGAWSDFEYDFSGSTFFYPIDLTKSYYKKPVNFSGAIYQGMADFSGSTYEKGVLFSAPDSPSTYQGWANFSGSTYQGWADFTGSTYQGWADFNSSAYQNGANFRSSAYQGGADFNSSAYQGGADFGSSIYKSWATFDGSAYKGWANFRSSAYKGGADFTGSTYQGWADFTGSTYQGWAYFTGSTYNDVADFSGSVFYQKVYFGADGDNSSFSRFADCAPQFYNETNHTNTLFGSPNNDFTVENGRGYPIYRNLDGLPLGCSFLTTEQKEYLEYKIQEIDETNNKLREVKDSKEKEELSKKLQALNKELYEWRKEATTV